MKRLWRWLRNSLLGLLLFVLLLLGLIFGVAMSPSATQWLAKTASEQLPGLEIENMRGRLATGLGFSSLNWASGDLAVSAEGLDSDWDFTCLQQKRFCLNRLHLARVELTLPSTESEPPPPSEGPIELPNIVLPVAVDIDDVQVKQLIIHQGDTRHEVKDIALSVSAEQDQVNLRQLALGYLNYSADLNAQVALRDDYPLQLNLDAKARPLLENHPLDVNLSAKGDLQNLSLQMQTSQAVEAALKAQLQPLAPTLPVEAELSWQTLGWPLDSHQQVKAQAGALTVTGEMDDWQVDLKTRLSGEGLPSTDLQLGAHASTQAATLQQLILHTLGGKAALAGDVAWAPELKGDVRLDFQDLQPHLQWPGVEAQLNGHLRANGGLQGEAWFAKVPELQVQGRLQDKPLQLSGAFEKDLKGVWRFEQVALRNQENQLDLHGQLDQQWDVKAKLALRQLSNFLPDLSGALLGDIHVSGALATPTVQADLGGEALQFQAHRLEHLKLNARVPELGQKSSQLQLEASNIEAAGQSIEQVQVALTGTQAKHQLQLGVDAEMGQVQTRWNGALDPQFNWQGQLQQADIKGFKKHLQLLQPIALAWQQSQKTLTVGAHCWREQQARLCLEQEAVVADSGKAKVSLKQFSMAQIQPWLPEGIQLKGQLGANADVSWSPQAAPNADVSVLLPGLDVSVKTPERKQPLKMQFQRISLEAKARADSTQANLRLNSQNLGNTQIDVGLVPRGEQLALSGNVNISAVQLAIAKAFLPDFQTLDGQLSAKGKISGTSAAPKFIGDVRLEGLKVAGKALPMRIDQGQVLAKVQGDKARLSGHIQTDKGRLDIGGQAAWPLPDWLAEVTLKGKELHLQQRPTLDAYVSPDLLIQANPKRVKVSGKVDIPTASVRIREVPPSAPTISKDIILEENGVPVEDPKAEQNPLGIYLDVQVSLGERVRFAGFGFRTRITGDLGISQKPEQGISLNGELDLVDGKYRSYGQDLSVRKGNILLVGPVEETALDVEAVRQAGDVVAGLRITGAVSEPQINLFSEPSLNEDEVLSYLVLGRPLNQSGEGEGNLLLQAAVGLGITNGRGVAQDVADALGIQDFTLESEGSGDDSQVVVSGKVTDKLSISYGVGVFRPIRTLTLRYDLTKKLYLETVQGLVDAIDIFYKFEF